MKKLFSILALFIVFATASQAQNFPKGDTLGLTPQFDSGTVKLNITLKAKQHFFLIDFLELGKDATKLNYIYQVVNKMDTTYNPEQSITVSVPSALVIDLYRLMGYQQERITTVINADIKTALLPQILNYSWIVQQLGIYNKEIDNIILQRTQRGFEYCKKSKV